MQNNANVVIVLLVISAAVLTAVLVGTAYADSSSTRAGDYAAATGSLDTERDLLYVIDIAAGRLNVYNVNRKSNTIDLGGSVDLARPSR